MVQNRFTRKVNGKWTCEAFAQSNNKTIHVKATAKTRERAEYLANKRLAKRIARQHTKWLKKHRKGK
jgi:hypothetical protein